MAQHPTAQGVDHAERDTGKQVEAHGHDHGRNQLYQQIGTGKRGSARDLLGRCLGCVVSEWSETERVAEQHVVDQVTDRPREECERNRREQRCTDCGTDAGSELAHEVPDAPVRGTHPTSFGLGFRGAGLGAHQSARSV